MQPVGGGERTKGGSKAVLRALKYLRHHRKDTAFALVALLLASAANLSVPRLVRVAIDQGLVPRNQRILVSAVLGLVALAMLRGVFNFLQSYLAERASQGVAFELREELFTRIQKLSFSYFDKVEAGQLLTKLTNDVEQVRTFVGSGAVQVAASVLMLIGCTALLFTFNVRLALSALVAIGPLFWILKRFVTQMGPKFKRVQGLLSNLNALLQENLQGTRVVRAFSAESIETSRYQGVNHELENQNLELVSIFSNNFPFIFFFANLGTLTVVGVGGFEIFHQQLTLGELIAFNSYLSFLLLPLLTLGFLAAQLSRAGTSAVRVFELLDTPIDIQDRPGADELAPIKGLIEFKDVHFRYPGSEREILSGINLTLQPGQRVAILGTTGSGKSTLTQLIPRFYDVSQGAILIDQTNIQDVTISSLRSQIAVVMQDALLFSGTVRDNIAYGRPDAVLEQIKEAAKTAQAAEFIESLPQGYDTLIGERGVGLSGGQKQRISIARALLVKPRLLILDDSTSAVDAGTEAALQIAMDQLMLHAQCTTLVIAQRLTTVKAADWVIVLDQGQVAAQGTHQALKLSSALYNDILGTQLANGLEEKAA